MFLCGSYLFFLFLKLCLVEKAVIFELSCFITNEPITIVAISICSSEVNLTLASLNAAAQIHKDLLNNILRQPMQFFELIPVGRILCRFSRDICALDTELNFNVYEVIESGCVVCVICRVVVYRQLYLKIKRFLCFFVAFA